MINPKTGERELAYFAQIDDIIPHDNADRLEIAVIGGWHVIVGKGEFKQGDIGVYFEIDSLLPDKEPFHSMEFLASKHFRIKTQKIRGELSQGFIVHPDVFKDTCYDNIYNSAKIIRDHLLKVEFQKNCIKGLIPENHILTEEELNIYKSDLPVFCTEYLGVKYYIPEDNVRKCNNPKTSVNKYKRMAQRNRKLFSHYPFRWLMRYSLGQKLLYLFYGRKTDALKSQWPIWVRKTDEERIQNMKWILQNKDPWIVTEKIDGTSLTVTYKPDEPNNGKIICSRNIPYTEYDDNIYVQIAKKYHIMEVLKELCEKYNLSYITFQGEIYGKDIQKRDYSIDEYRVAGFNLIFSDRGRLNSVLAKDVLECCNIPWVPILRVDYILPDTVEELLEYVESETSKLDGKVREGLVFRSPDGTKSFKAVSNKYLLKYHG